MKSFISKYWPHIIGAIIIYILAVRLFGQSESAKLLKKDLKKIEVEKEVLEEIEECLLDSLESFNEKIKQSEIKREQLRVDYQSKLNSIHDKIKEDENKINDIDSISNDSLQRYLSKYKYKPIKTRSIRKR